MTQMDDEIIKLKAQHIYEQEHAKRDKEELTNELKEIAKLQELKDFLLNQAKKVTEKKFTNTGLKIDNYLDNVEQFHEQNPFFYDKSQMFWLWNKEKYCYERTDEIEIMNMIDTQLGFAGQTVTNGIRGNYMEAFKRVGRKHLPADALKTWVQFRNKIVDIKTMQEQEASPNYFITNPIPWTLSDNEDTPVMDKLFTDWQGENKDTLYEVISYCLLTDYPIHIIFAMIGTGRNGKTQYQKIIERFLGQDNITSAELDSLVKERFESAKLYKKLVCTMGETNFGMISQTSLLKKLCGGDLISYEYKNKMPFTSHNYAKIIINTNSLPASSDTTEGFYRRWLILNWENNFEESGKDIVDSIPEAEYSALAKKSVRILKELLERGHFIVQGSIDERKNKYILASNPITLFLQDRCVMGDSFFVKAKDLYHEYLLYLQEKKRRIIKRKEFNQILAEEGYQAEHDKRRIEKDGQIDWENSYWIDGLKLGKSFSPISPISPVFEVITLHEETKYDTRGKRGNEGTDNIDKCIPDFEKVTLLINKSSTGSIGKHTLISNGIIFEQIEKWKNEGLIYESPTGVIRLI